MIDEKKMKREVSRVIAGEEPASPQIKLMEGFREYINMQPLVNVREAYFRQRMAGWIMMYGMRVLVEVE